MGKIRSVLKYDDNKLSFQMGSVVSVTEKVPAGFYDINFDQYGDFDSLTELDIPKTHPLLPCDNIQVIEEYLGIFYSDEYAAFMKENNIINKFGLILYGKPGIGKSNYINTYIKSMIENKQAIVFNINTAGKLAEMTRVIKQIRIIQNTLIVFVLEEFDELFKMAPNTEARLKNLTDGVDSIDNFVALASTNYIDMIPESLTDRKSRFKFVTSIEMGSDEDANKEWVAGIIKKFLKGATQEIIDRQYENCKGKSIDEIKNILIDERFGISVIENKHKKPIGFERSKPSETKIGFTNNSKPKVIRELPSK